MLRSLNNLIHFSDPKLEKRKMIKSILTNARQEDIASFTRPLGRKENEACQSETGALGSAVPDSTKNADEDISESQREDETLLIPNNPTAAMCLVKLPQYLLQRWSAVDKEGRQLGTLRVWDMENPETGLPYMTIYTPSEKYPHKMEEFDILVHDDDVKNSYVFATEAEDVRNDADSTEAEPRAGYKVLAGKVTCRYAAQPVCDEAYSRRMQERYETARARRHVRRVEYPDIIRMQGKNRSQKDIINTAIKKSKDAMRGGNPKDKFTRLQSSELFDLLFTAFGEKQIWGIKELHTRTRQPMVHLKDQLPKLAERVTSGKNKGKWSLRPDFEKVRDTLLVEASGVASGSGQNSGGEDDDNDDDMEVVM